MSDLERRSGCILVLDDDEVLRRSITRTLRMEGYHVIEARDAHEAFSALDEYRERIGAVLCDLILPGLDGREAANTISARHPDVRVLFTSGHSGCDSGRQELIKQGAPFLSKPFDVPTLLSAVDSVMLS